jgi:structural maintenance of chromosome 2
VKLNVNNPHFLIMQGRITKVINMNKKELLELLEEASGVSQYQTKKEQTKELIKKKDMKIQETNSILEHDVIPQFEALTKDKLVFD